MYEKRHGNYAALAELVNAVADLDTSSRWGRRQDRGKRLAALLCEQIYSTRFSDFALEFYTFVADNYALL